ncbi:MAG: hypothetical protein ACYS0I_14945 [Planctomycetota bacterium]|jgi:hypothetical protein
MKAIIRYAFMILSSVWLFMAVPALGDYELSWYTIDGGGGRSSGGQYELLGTIGQPDAAAMSGGGYELLGGFWPGGPLCFVDFYRFARFAEWWLEEECGEANNFCGGADLYEDGDNIVNKLDLKVFVEEWLCYCPAGWPLK